MRRLSWALVGLLVLLGGFGLGAPASFALASQPSRDCDANAVIRCGVSNFTQLQTGYQNSGVAAIYNYFGIGAQDINNISSTAVDGCVTRSGEVFTGQCSASSRSLVALKAMTAGRQNIAGSTAISRGGTTFYMRPPSLSFAASRLPAFVVVNNGRFAFAVIASCGNPVIATPVTPAVPKKLSPPTPSAAPAPTQSQTQTQTVNISPGVLAATANQAAAPAAKTLPNTGPGNILMLSGTTTAIGTLGHWYYSRRNRR